MTTAGTISGYGITAALPPAWEGRITTLAPVAPATAINRAVQATQAGRAQITARPAAPAPGVAATGETTMPFLHLANFPLPPRRGAFGTGAVELMSGPDTLIVLFEYSADSLGTALFAPSRMPRVLHPGAFNSQALQRILPGQGGYQAFFTESGRAFSLYVVLGSLTQAVANLPAVNEVLAGLRIDPA
ncbi:MAG: hypothetical protein M3Y91_10095 [Actinomycetota bacterium]|nr:hypothetical protein [Actinomycetota bacterium]